MRRARRTWEGLQVATDRRRMSHARDACSSLTRAGIWVLLVLAAT